MIEDEEFTCPQCGSHKFEQDDRSGLCHGVIGAIKNCGFTWPNSDNAKYFKGTDKFFKRSFVASAAIPHDRKMSVLSEEVGEIAKEIVDLGIARDKYDAEGLPFPRHREETLLRRIRTELVQVAAVCVAWCEAIDSKLESRQPNPHGFAVDLEPERVRCVGTVSRDTNGNPGFGQCTLLHGHSGECEVRR